jgi:hypothetical protein
MNIETLAEWLSETDGNKITVHESEMHFHFERFKPTVCVFTVFKGDLGRVIEPEEVTWKKLKESIK